MVKHTEEEIIKYIKENMIDSDGVVNINNTVPSWVYDYLRYRFKDQQKRVEWVKENTGGLLWISGYNTADVTKQRLRANNLIKIEKVNGKLVERLYSVDLSEKKIEIKTIEDQMYAKKIEKLRKIIKDAANKRGISAKEYVEKEMGIQYIGQKIFRNFNDIDTWIIENMKENTNADILRKVDGFNLARDFLKNNWKIRNEMYMSPFVDYIKLNFPQYQINAMLGMEKDQLKEYFFNILVQHYPDRVVKCLKKDRKKLYDEIKTYRKITPGGSDMTIKEFIEDYIGDGVFKYVTKNTTHKPSKWTEQYIEGQLIEVFGEGDVENPVVIKLKTNRNLERQIRQYCQSHELGRNEFLNPLGYAVDNERQLGNRDDQNTRRANTTHAEREVVKISVSTLTRNGKGRE